MPGNRDPMQFSAPLKMPQIPVPSLSSPRKPHKVQLQPCGAGGAPTLMVAPPVMGRDVAAGVGAGGAAGGVIAAQPKQATTSNADTHIHRLVDAKMST